MSKRIYGRRLAFIALLSLMAVIGLLTNVKPYAELLNEAERSKDLVSRALMFFNRSFSSERTVGVLLFAGILFAAYKVLGMEKDRREGLDCTVVAQRPKLMPHIPAMRERLAAAMEVPVDRVSVKATTEEGLGFSGEGLGIAAHAVALLENE